MHINTLSHRLKLAEKALKAKLGKDYLVSVHLSADIFSDPRLCAAAWHKGQAMMSAKTYVFEFTSQSPNLMALFHALEGAIEDFELWTPEAIAKTLGIAS